MADLKIKIGEGNAHPETSGDSCQDLLDQLAAKIEADYPEVADEAKDHIEALSELLHKDSEEDYSDDVTGMNDTKKDSMNELMNSE